MMTHWMNYDECMRSARNSPATFLEWQKRKTRSCFVTKQLAWMAHVSAPSSLVYLFANISCASPSLPSLNSACIHSFQILRVIVPSQRFVHFHLFNLVSCTGDCQVFGYCMRRTSTGASDGCVHNTSLLLQCWMWYSLQELAKFAWRHSEIRPNFAKYSK